MCGAHCERAHLDWQVKKPNRPLGNPSFMRVLEELNRTRQERRKQELSKYGKKQANAASEDQGEAGATNAVMLQAII